MAQELELKLRFAEFPDAAQVLALLKQALGIVEFTQAQLENIYFDTDELALNQARIALRIRRQGKQYIQTLKTKGQSINGLHQRGEWEWSVDTAQLDLSLLQGLEAWPSGLDLSALKPIFETNFTRCSAEIAYQGARIEVALDQGLVLTEKGSAPIQELELELKSGPTEALLALGQLLRTQLPLEPCDISKAETAYRLLRG